MAEIDVLKAQIVRQDLGTPWGFRLQGGADQGEPLHIATLAPGSPAMKIGLKARDEITEIGDLSTEGLTYQQVVDYINQHRDTLILTVERRAHGHVPMNPVMNTPQTEPLKVYQTYDMTGGQPAPRPSNYAQVAPLQVATGDPVSLTGSAAQRSTTVTLDPRGGTGVAVTPGDNVAILRNPSQQVTLGPILITGGQAKPEHREPIKGYQTYDMNGPKAPVCSGPKHNIEFRTVQAKPFEDMQRQPPYQVSAPVSRPSPPQPQPAPAPHSPPQYQPSRTYSPQQYAQPQSYSPVPHQYSPGRFTDFTPDKIPDPGVVQSKTFKVLQSLMSSEEPSSGVPGLPPPRSHAQEQWKAEQAAKRQGSSPRVKVFMPQQYNSPLGMYSAQNVVETFQAQAETVMDAMDRGSSDGQPMSDVQRALMES